MVCWDRWLGTQYTGGDAAERNQRTRARVHKQIANEKSKTSAIASGEVDEYAARRAVPEEDDVEYIKVSTLNTTTPKTSMTPTSVSERKSRRSRKGSILDGSSVVDVDVAGKWVTDVVGNVSGAKVR